MTSMVSAQQRQRYRAEWSNTKFWQRKRTKSGQMANIIASFGNAEMIDNVTGAFRIRITGNKIAPAIR